MSAHDLVDGEEVIPGMKPGSGALSTPDGWPCEACPDRQRHRYVDRMSRESHLLIGSLPGTLGGADV